MSETTVPPQLYEPIEQSWRKLRQDHPDPSKAVFIMMRFSETSTHQQILNVIRNALLARQLEGLRADDREYHQDLYWNVLTYMHGCGYGIAVFDRIEQEEFSPNVAFEVGYMKALGKEVCILKDKTLEELPTDLIGKLYQPFDPEDLEKTMGERLSKWLSDYRIGMDISFVKGQIPSPASRPIAMEELLPRQIAVIQSGASRINNVKIYRDKDGKVTVVYDEW